MTDEEKEAIDKLKRSANYFVMPIYETKIILELIEKQSKEIEELKDKNKFYNTAYNLGKTYSNKKWEDKIKAKIEEIKKYKDLARDSIEERIVIADSDSLNYGRKEAHEKDIEVLQSLLEKE